jgi:hypothetical protein
VTLNTGFATALDAALEQFRRERVYKRLNYLDSPQSARVRMEGRGEVLILSSNNYLGLCDEPAVVEAGLEGLRRFGAGTASVRFICGTFTIHRELENAVAAFVGFDVWCRRDVPTTTMFPPQRRGAHFTTQGTSGAEGRIEGSPATRRGVAMDPTFDPTQIDLSTNESELSHRVNDILRFLTAISDAAIDTMVAYCANRPSPIKS